MSSNPNGESSAETPESLVEPNSGSTASIPTDPHPDPTLLTDASVTIPQDNSSASAVQLETEGRKLDESSAPIGEALEDPSANPSSAPVDADSNESDANDLFPATSLPVLFSSARPESSSAYSSKPSTGTTAFSGKAGTLRAQGAETLVEKDSREQGSSDGSVGKGGDHKVKECIVKDTEMAHLTEEQRRIVAEQIEIVQGPTIPYYTLFRYTTKLELLLNFIGVLGAIVAGTAQPLMSLVFGALTHQFTDYSLALARADGSPEAGALVALARSDLLDAVVDNTLLLFYIGLGTFISTFIAEATWIYSGESATRRIREAYLEAVLRQNVAYFDKLGAGEVTTRIETDTHLIQEGISDKVAITASMLSTFFTAFLIAYIRNWRLALALSTIVPLIIVVGGVMNKFVSKAKSQQLEEVSQASSLAEEVISSVRNTHAFSTQKKLVEIYDVRNLTTMNIGIKSQTYSAIGMSIFFFIVYCTYALAFYYGTTLILQFRANSGQVVSVFFAVLTGTFSLSSLGPYLQSFSDARGAATKIFATIDRRPVIDSSSPKGLKPDKVEGVIELKNVDFIYPSRPAVQVLYKFSAVFPRGKMTALVGGSGSGKSTIVGLCERFYDPVGGSITLDGIELKDLNIKWLRTQIGLVSQEPTLFAGTVAGNIEHGLYGSKFENESPEQRRERVIEAAKQANADGFITALPQGYDTLIGERGLLLSGGQKQRIAIARAIVGDPQILLLDEATSALDTASEVIVQDALDRASAGRTTITIAHRLSTIRHADQIIVLTAGHILESAMSNSEASAHELLLRNADGAYSRLVTAQKFKEAGEVDDSDRGSVKETEKASAIGNLTREQVDEMAKNEKPQFEMLGRTDTRQSAASEALERKHKEDLESGKLFERKYGFLYLLRRMLMLNGDRWRDYVVGFTAASMGGCIYPIFGIIFGGVIGVFALDPITQRDELRSGGNRYAMYCFIAAIIAAIASFFQNFCWSTSAERLAQKLRKKTFADILRQDIAFFDREENSTGHLTSTIAEWAQKVSGLFGITGGVIIQSACTLLVGSIVGLAYAWKVALVGIACVPLTLAAGVVRLMVIVLKDEKNKKSHAQSAQMACEAAGAIRTVASLTREDDCCRIYSRYLDEPMRVSNRIAIWANMGYSITQALVYWSLALVFWFGAQQLAQGRIDTRTFFIVLISVIFGSFQAGQICALAPDMSTGRGAMAASVALADKRPEIDAQDPSGDKFEACSGHIQFKDVHFRYPTRPHIRVLRGLNLEVKPGQFVAIVGPSGCGKSTLIQLVERFYDPLAGQVLVDGTDISSLNVNSYRESVALVSQEPTLYAGSVRFNITLGATIPADQITQEQVEQACKDANIHDFITSLPDGYDTEVGGKGTMLSGGQKQRIAIARALIRNPKILLLDEATSALDSQSEKVVQAALDQAAKGRSTIAVAHRLSTIQSADVIFVLKDGRVAEQGKHFELMSKKGIYFDLVSQQDLEAH